MAEASPESYDSGSDQETDQLLRQYDIPTVIPKVRPGYGMRRDYYDRKERSPSYGTYLTMRGSSGEPEEDFSGMDNPTTRALHICKEMVLKPYRRLLLSVGWQPIFEDPVAWWQKVINVVHPSLIIIIVLVGYVIQYAACFRRDSSTYTNLEPSVPVISNTSTNVTPSPFYEYCQQFIISQYIIPDVLHSVAYGYSFYLMRFANREQLPTLMERVFLQTSPTETGFLSQGSLIRAMRFILYSGIGWVICSLVAQTLHLVARYDNIQMFGLTETNLVGKTIILILMMVSFVALDVVYTTVVINYTVQVALLIFYTEGLQEKLKQKSLDLSRAMREMGEIKGHLYSLNYQTAMAVSIVLFNFGAMSVLGLMSFFSGREKGFDTLMFVATAVTVCLWLAIMTMPIVQAARLSAACNSMKKIGHDIRNRPFGYQDTSTEELDSFLLYTSSLDMKAKLFLIPIKTSYLMFVVCLISFVVLLLFQSGILRVWI